MPEKKLTPGLEHDARPYVQAHTFDPATEDLEDGSRPISPLTGWDILKRLAEAVDDRVLEKRGGVKNDSRQDAQTS